MIRAYRPAIAAWLWTLVVLTLTACSAPAPSDEPVAETAQAVTSGPTLSSFTPNHGSQGTAITLAGSGFTGATGVAFAGTSAPGFSVTNDTTIAVTVPGAAQTGTVAVTTATGTATSKATFKVTPTLTSFAPTSGGAGTVVIVDGTGLLGTTAVTVAGTAATFTAVSDTVLDLTVAAGTGNGKVVVTTPGGSVTSTLAYAAGGPTITTFTAQGKQGATVTINGTGLTNVESVTFGGVPSSSLTTVSGTQIKAVVPSGALTGPIVLTTPLGAGTTTTPFNVTPTIGSFTPANGAIGAILDILGTGLSQTTSVAFGTATTNAVTVVSDTEITVPVPAGAATGKIVVTTAGGTATGGGTFTLQSVPVLSSFSPAAAAQGATVTITGTNMVGASAVTFNGVAAVISSSNVTTVKAVVPAGATTGIVTVSNEAGTGASAAAYPILPKLVSFAPTSGAVGASIAIDGSALTGATSVTFGTISAAFTVLSDTTLSALVPAGATNGKISVTTAGGTATGSPAFQVLLPPAITSFSPTSATAGATITVHGTAFTGATSVLFDGFPAASFNVTFANALTAVVPANASTGPITVTTPVGTATSTASLTLPTNGNKCAGVVCSALDACHVAGTCNATTGVCSNPTAANGASCNDGNSCTQTDVCQAGVCTGSSPVTCAAPDSCHVAGTCNPTTGACSNPAASDGKSCNDGNACTQSDACQGGTCTGAPITCAASDACHVAGTCSPTSGCSSSAAANGTSCSDGNACNGAETCSNGTCTAGTPPTNNPSCAGGFSVVLPPPPVSVNIASATYSTGGVDFIDPNKVLPAGLTVTTLPGAAGDLLGADAVYQFAPASSLPQLADARFTLPSALPAGTVALLWTRAGTSGPFSLQSIGRIDPTGLLVSFQLNSLGQEAITLLGSGVAFQAPGTGDGSALLGIAPQDGEGSFITLGGNLTVTKAGRIAVASPGITRPQHGLPSYTNGSQSFGGSGAVYEISGTILESFAQSVTSTQAASTGDIVVQSANWDLSFNDSPFASDAFSPSVSADGNTVTYTNSDQQIASGVTSPQILSVGPDGTPGNSNSGYSVVAPGGRWVAFESSSTNLDPAGTTPGIFFRDLSTQGPVQHLVYPQPTVYLADCTLACPAASGCVADTPESQGGCLSGQIPFAISDGGRYVFLKDDTASDPISPRTTMVHDDFTYSNAPCVNAYRFDRVTGTLEAVAYGDWFGIDRGGSTIVSHQCYENDVVANGDQGIVFAPLTVGALTLGGSVPVREVAVPLTSGIAAAFAQENGYSEGIQYQWGLAAAGTMTSDGNAVVYVADGFNTEQYTWQAWRSPVPSVIAGPTVSFGSTIAYRTTTVTYSGMLGQAPGDMFVLLDSSGSAINAYPTNGSTSGSFQIQALPAGNYFLDAYVSLPGDPNILKSASRTPLTLVFPTPTLTLASPLCEFTAFDVQFSGFLAATPNDYVNFGTVDSAGNFTLIDSQPANNQASGTLHFADIVSAGVSPGNPAYTFQVYYGTPDGRGEPLAYTMPVTFDVCLAQFPTSAVRLTENCAYFDTFNGFTESPKSMQTVGISDDGRYVTYVSSGADNQSTIRLIDRQAGNDILLDADTIGFGATEDGLHVAYSRNQDQAHIYLRSVVDQSLTLIPAQLTGGPVYDRSFRISNDLKTIAFEQSTSGGSSYIDAYYLSDGAWVEALGDASANFLGCHPSLTSDGQLLLYSTSTDYASDCSGGSNEFRPVLIAMAAPKPESACPPPNAIDTGKTSGTIEMAAETALLAPNGSSMAFSSSEDPYGGGLPLLNPLTSDPGPGPYMLTQRLDGSSRRFAGIDAGFSVFSLDSAGDFFFFGKNAIYHQPPSGSAVVFESIVDIASLVSSPGMRRLVVVQDEGTGGPTMLYPY